MDWFVSYFSNFIFKILAMKSLLKKRRQLIMSCVPYQEKLTHGLWIIQKQRKLSEQCRAKFL